MEFSKFSNIGQFRGVMNNIIRMASFNGYDENKEPIFEEPKKGSLPTLRFEASIKCHGTNAGCSLDENGDIFALSRSRVISTNQDNAGFAFFVESKKVVLKEMLLNLHKNYPNKHVYLYGEWCGGSIQKNVALTQLSKRLILFAVKIVNPDVDEESYYVKLPSTISSPENDIYNIREIGVRTIDIDFNKPEVAQNELIKIVDEVEAECPVGKYFGVSGIGEGVVTSCYDNNDVRVHIFKAKGEKHSKGTGKVKTLTPVDEKKEQLKRDFVNNHACKEWRLDQMYNETFDVINGGKGCIKKTGNYIKNVVQDVIKEEIDILNELKLEPRDVNSLISRVARTYMFSRMNKEVGL